MPERDYIKSIKKHAKTLITVLGLSGASVWAYFGAFQDWLVEDRQVKQTIKDLDVKGHQLMFFRVEEMYKEIHSLHKYKDSIEEHLMSFNYDHIVGAVKKEGEVYCVCEEGKFHRALWDATNKRYFYYKGNNQNWQWCNK